MNSNRMRVSVGLPVYNGEKYLEYALDSILMQTFRDFEVIICDNASTDRTQEICQAYAARDERVRYYRNEKNLGAAPNFNLTCELARGEYFKWAAYDDLIAPDFLLKCVEVLDTHPATVVCFPKAIAINENGEFLDNYDPAPDTSSPKRYERFRNLILEPHLAVQVFGLIRSSTLKKTGRMGNYPASDEVLLAELALIGEFYEIPERLFYTRLHREQSTQGAYASPRARVSWFDTSNRDKIVLHKWRYFFECLRAIRWARLSLAEQTRCYLYVGKWLVDIHHIRALGKDLLIAANQILHALVKPQPAGQGVLRRM